MKRLSRITFIASVATVLACYGILAYRASGQPVPTAPEPLREIVAVPDGGLKVTQPGTTLLSKQIQPVTTGDQGRGIVVLNAPKTTICDTLFQPGSDDALGLVGDCRGSVIVNCIFPVNYPGPNSISKAFIGYSNAASSATAGPIIGGNVGNAGNFYGCKFEGGSVRLRDGIWHYVDCEFGINALYGIDLIEGRINLIRPRFKTMPQPPQFGYWYHASGPCGVRVKGTSRIFISEPTLDGNPVTVANLCRRYPTDADRAAGRTAYGLPGSVPSSTFLTGLIR